MLAGKAGEPSGHLSVGSDKGETREVCAGLPQTEADKVLDSISREIDERIHKDWRNLAEIHAAPKWLWSASGCWRLIGGSCCRTVVIVAQISLTM